MKKLLILLIFFITFSIGAQTYEYDGDVWELSTNVTSDSKILYCNLNMEQSGFNDINYRLWGIHGVSFTLSQNKDGSLTVVFSYLTDIIEYTLPHYILISNEDFDFRMYGGKKTNGDKSIYQEDKKQKVAYNMIQITLNGDKRTQLLSIDEDKYLWIDEMQYDYGIVYGLPKEIISEFNTFIKETDYEKKINPNDGPDIDAPELQSIG
jgi:hypothetical protein